MTSSYARGNLSEDSDGIWDRDLQPYDPWQDGDWEETWTGEWQTCNNLLQQLPEYTKFRQYGCYMQGETVEMQLSSRRTTTYGSLQPAVVILVTKDPAQPSSSGSEGRSSFWYSAHQKMRHFLNDYQGDRRIGIHIVNKDAYERQNQEAATAGRTWTGQAPAI